MSRSSLHDAFGHHMWATLRLIDECGSLTEDQLTEQVPGTYGPILDTLRHLVGSDAWYLFVLTGGRSPQIEEDAMPLEETPRGHGATRSRMALAPRRRAGRGQRRHRHPR